jgi:hypothetical protein
MKGDFSRIRYNPSAGYTAVLDQQGRVSLDADSNEQAFIDDHLRGTTNYDVVGAYGAPADNAGFAISVLGDQILIGPGRYYVDGLLCENLSTISYDSQPYLLGATTAAALLSGIADDSGANVVQLSLEVWQRYITELDDPCLQEPAIGQADTTGRLQTVWRVVASAVPLPAAPEGSTSTAPPCCQAMPGLTSSATATTGTMMAQANQPSSNCGCQPVPAAGYQGLENQLYRVEIHQGGQDTAATFKWSRENGSVVSALTAPPSGSTVTVNSLGPDANLGFQVQQWVELSDDNNLFGQAPNQPGSLYQIQGIQRSTSMVTLSGPPTVNSAQNARMRRWDQTAPTASSSGIPLQAGTWIDLEYGVQVCFTPGYYQPGDYWTVPARAATGTIDWPPCSGDGSQWQPPQSFNVRTTPLACIHWMLVLRRTGIADARVSEVGTGVVDIGGVVEVPEYTVDDCRTLFQSLQSLTQTIDAPPPAAVHVESISWSNDDIMTLDALVANGLTVNLDQAPSMPLSGANFLVTLELVQPPDLSQFPVGTFNASGGTASLPSTLLRLPVALDSEVTVNTNSLLWQLPAGTANSYQNSTLQLIETLLNQGALGSFWGRVRVRLPGHAIFANGPNGTPIYLDGQTFGQLGTRADGVTQRIDLRFPSGNKVLASDLDSWFYLVPMFQLSTMTFTASPVTVEVNTLNNVTRLQSQGNSITSQQATINFNYPAAAAGSLTVTVAVTTASGAALPTLVSIPATVNFAQGASSVAVPIGIVGNPGNGVTANVELTATIAAGSGQGATQSASFALIGVQPPTSPFRIGTPVVFTDPGLKDVDTGLKEAAPTEAGTIKAEDEEASPGLDEEGL